MYSILNVITADLSIQPTDNDKVIQSLRKGSHNETF